MLCEKCPAKITGGCFISKKRTVRCDREEKYIKRARDVLLIAHELDKIAAKYIETKDKSLADEWWAKLREVYK